MRIRAPLVLAIAAVLSGAPSAAFAADPSPPLRPTSTPPAGTDGVGPGSPAQSAPASTIDEPGGLATPAPRPHDAIPATSAGPMIEPQPAPASTMSPAVPPSTPAAAPVGGAVAVHVVATAAPATLASPNAIDPPTVGATPAPAPIETTPPASDPASAVASPDFTFMSLVAGIGALGLSAVLLLLAVWRRLGPNAAAAVAAAGSSSGEERVAALLRRRTERLGRIPIDDDPIVASLGIPPPSTAGRRGDARKRRTPEKR